MKYLATLLIFMLSTASLASELKEFDKWLSDLKLELVTEYKFSEQLIDKAFNGVKYNKTVIDLDRAQPEFIKSTGSYLAQAISNSRILNCKKYSTKLSNLFKNIYDDYRVQDRFLLAFWAMESNFSSGTGNMDLIESLATLAFDGRRGEFFKNELINALKVLEMENFYYKEKRIIGSWAGAMGATQFMPMNILKYALDYNNDGKIDMWSSEADFLASSANLLKESGWNGEESWGYEISLPNDFDYLSTGLDKRMSVSNWQDLGVRLIDGSSLPDSSDLTSIYLPQGHLGPKFIVYNNFFTIFKWNNSYNYALGVSILSDLIEGKATYFSKFNLNETNFLSFALAKKIQEKLNLLGFSAGPVDGIPGTNTFRAIQKFQNSIGEIEDGYITPSLVNKLISARLK